MNKKKIEKLDRNFPHKDTREAIFELIADKINQIIDQLESEVDSQKEKFQQKITCAQCGAYIELFKEETPKERWKPEEGEDYWCITTNGEIRDVRCWNYQTDKDNYNFGNVFHTEKEAEEAREKIKSLLNEL